MEEQANKILVELLQKAVGGIDAAVSFSQAQIPDVVHQLLIWSSVSSAMFQFLGALMVAGSFFALYYIDKCRKRGDEWTIYEGERSISSIAFELCRPVILSMFVLGVFIIMINFDWLKIWLAPKLYLLEYAASLIK